MKKLGLTKETLRLLNGQDLHSVHGGMPVSTNLACDPAPVPSDLCSVRPACPPQTTLGQTFATSITNHTTPTN